MASYAKNLSQKGFLILSAANCARLDHILFPNIAIAYALGSHYSKSWVSHSNIFHNISTTLIHSMVRLSSIMTISNYNCRNNFWCSQLSHFLHSIIAISALVRLSQLSGKVCPTLPLLLHYSCASPPPNSFFATRI